MEKTVHIRKVPAYDQPAVDAAVEALFAALPCTGRLHAGSRVLLKPNLLAKHPPEHAVTTHPTILTAVIRALKKRGVATEDIICADSMGGLYNAVTMSATYRTSGLEKACADEGVICYTDCQWAPRKVENGKVMQEFNLIQPVHDADFIIDLPKMKTHMMTGCTAATKNLFGCIPGLQKAELHTRFPDRERFGEMLIDLLETVKPDMALLDGIIGMEGDGPAGGNPREIGVLMAGEDLLNIDLAVCAMQGMEPMRVPYLEAAHNRGLCGKAFDTADLAGETEGFGPIPGYQLPNSYQGSVGSTDFADQAGPFAAVVRMVEKHVAPHPIINRAKCIGCGKCAEICPRDTIRVSGEQGKRKAKIDPAKCIRCFCCHEMCPVKAIDVKRVSLFRL